MRVAQASSGGRGTLVLLSAIAHRRTHRCPWSYWLHAASRSSTASVASNSELIWAPQVSRSTRAYINVGAHAIAFPSRKSSENHLRVDAVAIAAPKSPVKQLYSGGRPVMPRKHTNELRTTRGEERRRSDKRQRRPRRQAGWRLGHEPVSTLARARSPEQQRPLAPHELFSRDDDGLVSHGIEGTCQAPPCEQHQLAPDQPEIPV